VTVIVPVYNPGPALDYGVRSLLGQSMPSGEFEVIYIDDGSTDGSDARLDELAAQHDNISVHHIPNSGWPGRPRNVGIDNARGRYVQFMDQDDALGPEALERLYEVAERSEADLVIGKVASDFRPVLHEMFRADLERETIYSYPLLIRSLTPHKLFRLSFLRDHQIRFPEGKRRLEDQPFVSASYFAAKSVAVLSSYVCYFYRRRDDGQNSAGQAYSPLGYYNNLREVLDIVEKNTEPGEFRDLILRRFFNAETVGRLGGKGFAASDLTEFRVEQFNEIRRIAVERFGPGVAAGAAAAMRVRGHLMLADDIGGIQVFARYYDEIRGAVTLDELSWRDGKLQLAITAYLRDGEGAGAPLTFEAEGDRLLLAPHQLGVDVPSEARDVTAELADSRADIIIRNRATSAEYYLPARIEATLEQVGEAGVAQRLSGTATLDPLTALFGEPLTPGVWDISVRVAMAGWSRTTRLGSTRAAELDPSSSVVVAAPDAPLVLAYWTQDYDNLSVAVRPVSALISQRIADFGGVQLSTDGRRTTLSARLPMVGVAGGSSAGRFVVRRVGSSVPPMILTSTTRVVDGWPEISAVLPRRQRVRTRGLSLGIWRVGVELGSGDTQRVDDLGVRFRVGGVGPIETCPVDVDLATAPRALVGRLPLLRRLRRLLPK
jgi:poly(ribitol-phosphate) beta-N-acetylglucosaminyltransferase